MPSLHTQNLLLTSHHANRDAELVTHPEKESLSVPEPAHLRHLLPGSGHQESWYSGGLSREDHRTEQAVTGKSRHLADPRTWLVPFPFAPN